MEIMRTVKLRVDLDPTVAAELVAAYTAACNYVSGVAFDQGISNRRQLHDLCYAHVRAEFGLPAQIACSVITDVAAKYQALRTAQQWPPARAVVFRKQPVLLQGSRGRDFGFSATGLSISTHRGRYKHVSWQGGPPAALLADPAGKVGGGRLWVKGQNVYLAVTVSREVDVIQSPSDAVVGIDRGMNYLATAVAPEQAAFFAGGRILHIRKQYRERRRSLQRKKAQLTAAKKSTRNVRRVLKRLSGRERRFMRDTNHVVSKRLAQFAQQAGNAVIALEDLQGIRARARHGKAQRAAFHGWAFYELEQLLAYKAEDRGLALLSVDARNTSQGCSRCGHVAGGQRTGHTFVCKACGYHLHADLNAARNIRLRGILARQVLGQDGVPSITPEDPTDDPGWNPGEARVKLPPYRPAVGGSR